MEKHHIIPRFLKGSDNPENIIYLSFKDHIQAHLIRYIEFKDIRDFAAYNLMCGFDDKGWQLLRKSGAYATQETLKKQKKHFWSSEFQKEMGQGSLKHPDALQIRSTAGKKGGRQTQKNKNLINIQDRFLFIHESGQAVCIFNYETCGDVLRELQLITPQKKWSRISPLITQKRQKMYGWSCHPIQKNNKIIRSEVKVGKTELSELFLRL